MSKTLDQYEFRASHWCIPGNGVPYSVKVYNKNQVFTRRDWKADASKAKFELRDNCVFQGQRKEGQLVSLEDWREALRKARSFYEIQESEGDFVIFKSGGEALTRTVVDRFTKRYLAQRALTNHVRKAAGELVAQMPVGS